MNLPRCSVACYGEVHQTYSSIKRLWKEKFESQVTKRESKYVLSRMNKLQTSFQNEKYLEAISITRTLFGYFSRIANSKVTPLRTCALAVACRFWSLEGILERKL